MPKIVSVLMAGALAALVALSAEQHLTWRSGVVAALAFLGAIAIPAVHPVGSTSPATSTSSSKTVGPPYTDLGAVDTPQISSLVRDAEQLLEQKGIS